MYNIDLIQWSGRKQSKIDNICVISKVFEDALASLCNQQNIFSEQTPLFYFINVKILKVQCTGINAKGTVYQCKRNGIKINRPPSNRVDWSSVSGSCSCGLSQPVEEKMVIFSTTTVPVCTIICNNITSNCRKPSLAS